MSTPDYATLARQFMDMWQTQMSNAMTDPGFVTAMMDTMRQPAPKTKKAKNEPKETQNPQHAPTYESRDEQLDELARRVRALEKRVRELESERADAAKPKRKSAIRKRAVKPSEKKPKAPTKRSTKSAATTKKPAAKRTSARTGGKKPTKRK